MANYHPKSLTNKHKLALRYISLGKSPSEAALEVGLTPCRISQILTSPLGQQYMEQLETELDQEFKHLYKKVVRVIGDAMDCSDASIALAGANLWLKAHGKFVHKVETRNLTAEDIVAKIISGELQPPRPQAKQLEGAQTFEEAEFHPVAEAKDLN